MRKVSLQSIYPRWNLLQKDLSNRGSTTGNAYNSNDYNCPYDPAYDWKYANHYNNWADAGDF